MPARPATTIFEVLWLLYRRMVEGKDRRRKATKAQQKSFLSDVPEGVERQGAGSFDVQIVRDSDGTWWEDHLDWSHAMRWHPFNTNAVNPLDLRNLMDHFYQTIDKQWWATAPLETLLRESLSGNELHASTYECILELHREGAFEDLRRHILDKCPHLADLFHEHTGPEIKMPASWFKIKFGIPTARLRSARKRGKIRADKPGRFWQYVVVDAQSEWPEDEIYIPDSPRQRPPVTVSGPPVTRPHFPMSAR